MVLPVRVLTKINHPIPPLRRRPHLPLLLPNWDSNRHESEANRHQALKSDQNEEGYSSRDRGWKHDSSICEMLELILCACERNGGPMVV
ncbi:hypothetical protein EVAR_22272_1 [Eumeta japonica]|uniref:Uncharacterized protein n=1 Tax=Eumeta variegata TaxID=151549 RepID=A0A4C1UAE8_EUMVA|nr:hypothetical protein EVAR_22272_1 [Eumeta japonica]